jgi:transcriptional regulator with XRE-family HTH domain
MLAIMTPFRDKLIAAMRARGDTASDLARVVSVSPTTVDRWLRGARPFHPALVALAHHYARPIEYFADDHLDEPPAPEVLPEERPLLAAIRAMGVSLAWRRLLAVAPPAEAAPADPAPPLDVSATVEGVPTVAETEARPLKMRGRKGSA